MSTLELKTSLICRIQQEENENILKYLLNILNSENKIYYLSEWEKEQIAIAQEQIKNGEYMTDDEQQKYFDKWLEE